MIQFWLSPSVNRGISLRILFVTHNLIPRPTGSGSAIHVWSIISTLKDRGYQIDLINYGVTDFSPGEGWKNKEKETQASLLGSKGINVHILPKVISLAVNSSSGYVGKVFNVIKHLFAPEPLDYYEGPLYQKEIEKIVESCMVDAIIGYSFEAISACINIQGITKLASVVDMDHLARKLRMRKQRSINPNTLARQFLADLMNIRMVSVETDLLKQCNLVFSHAAHHCRWLQQNGLPNAVYLPVAVLDHAPKLLIKPTEASQPLRIIMVGMVTGVATQRGLRILIKEIIPALDDARTNLEFELHIIGAGELDTFTKKGLDRPWIKQRGFVQDIASEFMRSDVLLVPTPDTLGFRTRIAEGFSFGCCVVTHVANTFGMPELSNDNNCLVGKNGAELSSAIIRCLNSRELRERLSSAARQTYIEKYDGKKVAERMASALEMVCYDGHLP